MNELLNNPVVVETLGKIGVTVETGLAEYVRYTAFSGLLWLIVSSFFLLLSIGLITWLGWKGYKEGDDFMETHYYVSVLLVFVFVSFPSILIMITSIEMYMMPIGYMVKEVLSK